MFANPLWDREPYIQSTDIVRMCLACGCSKLTSHDCSENLPAKVRLSQNLTDLKAPFPMWSFLLLT